MLMSRSSSGVSRSSPVLVSNPALVASDLLGSPLVAPSQLDLPDSPLDAFLLMFLKPLLSFLLELDETWADGSISL